MTKKLTIENNAIERLNSLCPYFTMFPLEYPQMALKNARLSHRVLDPFCGRGTTLAAARSLGISCVGIDSSPIAVAISSAKIARINPEKVILKCKDILSNSPASTDLPVGDFWSLCFHKHTLSQLCKLRTHFVGKSKALSATEIALRALILGGMHGPQNKGDPSYFSNQMPRTYATKPNAAIRFWKKNSFIAKKIDVIDIVEKRAKRHYDKELMASGPMSKVYLADSRKITDLKIHEKFDWVVCSPPYPGMRTYLSDQWLRHWFLGHEPQVEYNTDMLIGSGNAEKFSKSLGLVWAGVDSICNPGAQIRIRMGCLPSLKLDPKKIIGSSLDSIKGKWKIDSVKSAGVAEKGKRQAKQFMGTSSTSVREYDFEITKR